MGNGDVKPVDRCGAPGQPCAKPSDYAVVNPHNPPDGVHLDRILVERRPYGEPAFTSYPAGFMIPVGVMDPYYKDNPETPERKEKSELDKLVNGDWFVQSGYNLLLRSASEPFSFYGQKSMAHFLTFDNEISKEDGLLSGLEGMSIHAKEMMGLASCAKLGLSTIDVMIKPDAAPKNKNDFGTYYFTRDESRLNEMIAVLRNSFITIADITMKRREDVAAHLEKVIYDLPENKSLREQERMYDDSMFWQILLGVVLGGIPTVYFGRLLFKDVKNWKVGRVQKIDARQQMLEKLKKYPDFHMNGLEEQARMAWEMVEDPEWPHLIVYGETGCGKDALIEEMINQAVRHEPWVPEEFWDARIVRLTPARMIAGTKYRGTPADNILEVVKSSAEDRTIVIVDEIDRFLMSGGTTDNEGEKVSHLLLSELQANAGNVMLIGSTSRYEEFLEDNEDLVRRFYDIEKGIDPLSRVIENLSKHTREEIGDKFKVTFTDEAMEAVGRLAERLYRPTTPKYNRKTGNWTKMLARYDAVKRGMKAAAKKARHLPDKTVRVEQVVEGIALLAKQSFEPGYVEEILRADADYLMVDGYAKEMPIKVDEVLTRLRGAMPDITPGDSDLTELTERDWQKQARSVFELITEKVLQGKGEEYFDEDANFKNDKLPELLRESMGLAVDAERAEVVRAFVERSRSAAPAQSEPARTAESARTTSAQASGELDIIMDAIMRDVSEQSFRDQVPEVRQRVAEMARDILEEAQRDGRLAEYVAEEGDRNILKPGIGQRLFEEVAERLPSDPRWDSVRGSVPRDVLERRRAEREARERARRDRDLRLR